MERWLRRFVEVAVLPPAGPLWLAVLGGLLLLTRWRKAGVGAIAISLVALFLLSTAAVESWMLSTVDHYPPLDLSKQHSAAEATDVQAIVVLGAGVRWGSREWGYDAPSPMAVARMHYAAEVHRHVDLPVLVTGYTGDGMKDVMQRDFKIPVRWIEDRSYDTRENALFSAELLRSQGVNRVYLVTHFWHMPRSVMAFEAAGLDVVPAPLGFLGAAPNQTWLDRVRPKPSPLATSKLVVREWIGLAWYRWQLFRSS